MLTFGISPLSEFVLLIVAYPEDVISNTVRDDQRRGAQSAKDDRVKRKIASLQAVYEWHPGKIAHIQHVPEPICRYVHLREDGRLGNASIKNEMSESTLGRRELGELTALTSR